MLLWRIYLFFLLAFPSLSLHCHGFAFSTPIKHINHSQAIGSLYQHAKNKTHATSFNFKTRSMQCSRIVKTGTSSSNCYCRVSFDRCSTHDLICTPSQAFYDTHKDRWVSAIELHSGDTLLTAQGIREVTSIQFIAQPLKVFALEVEKTHTFYAGHHQVLTHNMFLPTIVCSLGVSLKDFDSLEVSEIKPLPLGKRGKLPDGRDINVRTASTEKVPTLEIYDPTIKRSIKIRYTGYEQ